MDQRRTRRRSDRPRRQARRGFAARLLGVHADAFLHLRANASNVARSQRQCASPTASKKCFRKRLAGSTSPRRADDVDAGFAHAHQ